VRHRNLGQIGSAIPTPAAYGGSRDVS
jgi:hypothetical protein